MAIPNTSDPTFGVYTSNQAKAYSEGRPGYASELYQTILKYHVETQGHLDNVVDVGCGPGRATRELARFFKHAVGLDAGYEMIQTARELGGTTQTGESIKYEVSPAEKIADVEQVQEGKVDMLTAAAAVHWFSMPDFWEQAARIVRPGGTVALWTTGSLYCHSSTPNAVDVNQIMRDLEDRILAPFELPPNQLSRTLYDNLVLPWDLDSPSPSFYEEDFRRLEWDRDGVLSDPVDFFGGSKDIPLEVLEKGYGTGSTVTRWREAHPHLVDTEDDCIIKIIKQIREVIGHEAGDKIRGSTSTVLLLFKRK